MPPSTESWTLLDAVEVRCAIRISARGCEVVAHGLYRSRRNRVIAGVCGGISEQLGVPTWLIRLAFAITATPGGVSGLLLYLVCWAIIPVEPASGAL